ncbi:hypothetical protein LXEBMM8_EKPBGFGD_01523 [Lactiplantibacillus xiangfangensis]
MICFIHEESESFFPISNAALNLTSVVLEKGDTPCLQMKVDLVKFP